MGKAIRNVFRNENFSLTECTDGYFLYDKVIGMNLSMRAKTEQDAFIEALLYYQRRLQEVKHDYKEMHTKVMSFVSLFNEEDD